MHIRNNITWSTVVKIERERQNKKYACDCGGSYTYAHKKLHVENKKHKQYIESLKYEAIRRGLAMVEKLDKHFGDAI